MKVDARNQKLLGIGRVDAPEQEVTPGDKAVMLKSELLELLKSDPAAFSRRCGEHFVTRIDHAATALLVANVRTADRETREKIKTAVEGGFAGVEVAASSTRFLQTVANQKLASFRVYIEGGDGSARVELEPEKFFEALSQLGALAKAGARPTFITLEPYSNVANWPADAGALVGNTASIDMARAYLRIDGLRAAFQDVVDAPSEYILGHGALDRSAAGRVADSLRAVMASVESFIAACTQTASSTACERPRTLDATDHALRSRLPLPAMSFPVDAQLRKDLNDSLAYHERWTQLRAAVARCRQRNPDGSARMCRRNWVAELARLDSIVPDLLKRIPVERAQWTEKYVDESVYRLILEPNRTRCSIAPIDSWCLTNEQLVEHVSRLRATRSVPF